MSDAKRRKVFAGIPGRESRDTAIAFVLPDAFANSKGIGVGDMDWGCGFAGSGQAAKTQTNRQDAVNTMVG